MWPFLVNNSRLVLPTYIVVNSLVFSLAVIWLHLRAGQRGYDRNSVLDVALAVMLGGFVGARLFHVFFEHPGFYWDHPLFIFKFWYGGFVYYGGVLGSLAFSAWLCRAKRYDFFRIADLMAPVLAGGYALGRLGCLAAGCCYGRPTSLPWAIHFPPGVEAPAGIGLHPTQIYASLWETVVLIVLLTMEKKKRLISRGQLFGLWLTLHGLGRAVIEQFRDDFRGPTLFNLSVSTWLSGAAMIFGIWLVATAGKEKVKNASPVV